MTGFKSKKLNTLNRFDGSVMSNHITETTKNEGEKTMDKKDDLLKRLLFARRLTPFEREQLCIQAHDFIRENERKMSELEKKLTELKRYSPFNKGERL